MIDLNNMPATPFLRLVSEHVVNNIIHRHFRKSQVISKLAFSITNHKLNDRPIDMTTFFDLKALHPCISATINNNK